MGFFLCFLVSLGGFLLVFLPLEIPLYIAPTVAATGWILSHLLKEKTPTDRRFRRFSGVFALLATGIVVVWYVVFWIFLWLQPFI